MLIMLEKFHMQYITLDHFGGEMFASYFPLLEVLQKAQLETVHQLFLGKISI
jgi:hypothetical protein